MRDVVPTDAIDAAYRVFLGFSRHRQKSAGWRRDHARFRVHFDVPPKDAPAFEASLFSIHISGTLARKCIFHRCTVTIIPFDAQLGFFASAAFYLRRTKKGSALRIVRQ
jgi:hypothetical protein